MAFGSTAPREVFLSPQTSESVGGVPELNPGGRSPCLMVRDEGSETWRVCPSVEASSCGTKNTGFETLRTSRPGSAVFQLCDLEQVTG